MLATLYHAPYVPDRNALFLPIHFLCVLSHTEWA